VLYSHVLNHGATLHDVTSAGLECFLAPRLSSQARSELASIQLILDAWTPTVGIDKRCSPLEFTDHRLISGKIYKLATSLDGTCAFYKFVWQNHAPPKVKFFAWLLLQGRIQCKSNLKMKNIVDSDVCDLCNRSPETADHLVSGCPFA